MYNKLLITFITVVQCGSFSRASEKLYVTNTAIMKQMNQLEEELGLKLLIRSKTGVSLTNPGKLIYDKAIEFIQLSNRIVDEAKQKEFNTHYTIRLGSSFLNPSNLFIDLWRPIAHKYPEFSFEIIPYEDINISSKELLDTKIDVVYCSSQPSNHKKRNYYYVKDTPFEIALTLRHPLASNNLLDFSDLEGYTLRIGEEHHEENIISQLAHYLKDKYPDIHLKEIPRIYTLETFNEADLNNDLLLTLPQWNNIHPNLFNKTIIMPYHNQFGIITSTQQSIGVQLLIDALKKENIIK